MCLSAGVRESLRVRCVLSDEWYLVCGVVLGGVRGEKELGLQCQLHVACTVQRRG